MSARRKASATKRVRLLFADGGSYHHETLTLPAEAVLLNEGRRDREGVIRLTIREGRNRQVRRMCEAVGHPVQTLRRTRFGPIADRHLKPGQWRELSTPGIAALKDASVKKAPAKRKT